MFRSTPLTPASSAAGSEGISTEIGFGASPSPASPAAGASTRSSSPPISTAATTGAPWSPSTVSTLPAKNSSSGFLSTLDMNAHPYWLVSSMYSFQGLSLFFSSSKTASRV